MKITSTESPVGLIHEGTIFQCKPFNFVFDGEFEMFSFYVPEMSVTTVHKCKDITEIIRWACVFVGRKMDLKRGAGGSMRVVEVDGEPQIEVRLKLRAPWYFEGAVKALQEGDPMWIP